MKLAIIGAGEGSRLKEEGIATPKPLIKINGVPLIERIIRCAAANHLTSAELIINEAFAEVKEFLERSDFGIPVRCELRSTPSSMHTLFALQPRVDDSPFCMTTVDSVFRKEEFRNFVSFIRSTPDADGVLAITDYIDDEKPLCVRLDAARRILEFMDSAEHSHWATGGIYYFTPRIFQEIDLALSRKIERLRNFLRLLIERNYLLKAYPFSKIIDVDHRSDIAAAEEFLRTGK